MTQESIKIELDKKGRYEMWKLNRKGYYNFIKYLTEEEYNKINNKK